MHPKLSSIPSPTAKWTKRILLSVPHMGETELSYVKEAFDGNWLSTVGPNLTALEQEFSMLLGLPSVALGSATAGLHLGLKLLNVGAGDEVVTPTLTFVASANPILYQRAVPVFVDCERTTWGLDPDLLASLLKKRARSNDLPKAVCVVHLFGQSADIGAIQSVCQRYEVPVLEDAAESLGAQYKGRHPGTLGAVGIFSFNGNKMITGTTGGMLVAREAEWVERARKWSTQSRDEDPCGLNNYIHSEVGYNYRMSNVVAGIVRGQLNSLELRIQQRRAVFARYSSAFNNLGGLQPQKEVEHRNDDVTTQPTSRHTRWLSCFLIDEREFGMCAAELIRFLAMANVEARPVWKPMHTQPLYRRYGCVGGEAAEDLHERGFCLPSSSSLSEDEQAFVIQRVYEAHRLAKR